MCKLVGEAFKSLPVLWLRGVSLEQLSIVVEGYFEAKRAYTLSQGG